MSQLSHRLKRLFGKKHKAGANDWRKSYSQEGEDLVLLRFFEQPWRHKGFFVDVGAHHPTRFSNTKLFYDYGWRGISIDPRPGFAKEFLNVRPGDIAVEAGISAQPGELTYYMFDEPALNGFDARLSEHRNSSSAYKIIDQRTILTDRLERLIEQHLPSGQSIDFMTIDVEGLDYDVICSNNWSRFRPRFVLVEIFGKSLTEVLASDSARYLTDCGYTAVSRTRHTVFFEEVRANLSSAAA